MKKTLPLIALLVCGSCLPFPLLDAAEPSRKTKSKQSSAKRKPAGVTFSAALANNASRRPPLSPKSPAGSSVLRAQILLDRARFTPGEIDGRYGTNMRKAVAAYNAARGLRGGERVDAGTWTELNRDAAPVVVEYTLVAEDVAGPFVKIPEDMVEKAALPALGFQSALEGLAEKFHASPKLLQELNPGARFDQAGAKILVPSVGRAPLEKLSGASIKVTEGTLRLTVEVDGDAVASYPATVGSEHDPLPLGKWKINGVGWNPSFNYNPDLFWDAEPGDKKAKLPAGPNNPVGVVWIDLSKDHYGIHGSPEPSTIGKTTTHGCIRLTNWDASELATLVSPGTPVSLER